MSELAEGLKWSRTTEGPRRASTSHGDKRNDLLLKRASKMSHVMKLNEAFMQIPFFHSWVERSGAAAQPEVARVTSLPPQYVPGRRGALWARLGITRLAAPTSTQLHGPSLRCHICSLKPCFFLLCLFGFEPWCVLNALIQLGSTRLSCVCGN